MVVFSDDAFISSLGAPNLAVAIKAKLASTWVWKCKACSACQSKL